MADDQNMRPPDMVAAGATPPPQDQGSLIDALRSRGTLPAGLAQSMAQPSMMVPPTPAPANPGLAFGSGMMAGLSGHQTNPYLQQHGQFQENESRRQQEMMRLQERIQQQREKQNESAMRMGEGLLESDSPEAQQAGARTVAGLYKAQYGIDTKPEWLIRQKDLSKDERDQIAVEIDAGLTDQMILGRHPRLSSVPGGVGVFRQIMKSPAFQEKFYGSTQEERELRAIETRGKVKLEKDRQDAEARIEAGLGTARDYRLAGAKSAEDVGRDALETSVRTGQPVPPELAPYVKLYEQKLKSSGIKNRIELAIAKNNGDYEAAWKDLEAEKTKSRRPTADEYRFNLLQERQRLIAKGPMLTQQERIRLSTIDDFLASKDRDNTTTSSNERAVVIKPEMVKAYQDSVNETVSGLTGRRILPNDPSPTVNIQGHAVPKTQLIEEQYALDHPGMRIQVQWNPDKKQFQIVRAWETTTSKRAKVAARGRGPLNPDQQQDDEEDGD